RQTPEWTGEMFSVMAAFRPANRIHASGVKQEPSAGRGQARAAAESRYSGAPPYCVCRSHRRRPSINGKKIAKNRRSGIYLRLSFFPATLFGRKGEGEKCV